MRAVALALALLLVGTGTAAADGPAKKGGDKADKKIDLFPAAVLGEPGLLRGIGGGGGDDEKSPGLTFGGTSWKQDAAMIGAMAVGFAALVGLCSGGACMLPDWLPGTPDPGGINAPSPEPDRRIPHQR